MRNFTELERKFKKWKNKVNKTNRYYDKSELLTMLYKYKKSFSFDVLQGDRFYRGRIFNLDDVVSNNKQYKEWLNSYDVFQGYNQKDSGTPPAKFASEGRLNAKGISFLYTCRDVNTVIYEVRPTRFDVVSVAEGVAQSDLIFADLTYCKAEEITGYCLADLIGLIADEFATPHYAGHNYAFTQYLAGHFMNMGFDGVIFESSLNPKGENFVFFYPNDCKFESSKLFKVDEITILHHWIPRSEV